MTLLAPKLTPGCVIGVVAPAGPVEESALRPGLQRLRSAGFRVRTATHLYDRKGFLAGGDEDRLQDLMSMLLDPEIRGVFCARGGYGSMRLLDALPYGKIEQNPKILAGFSDITALLLAVHAKTGLVTFHGPVVRDLGGRSPRNAADLMRLLSGEQPREHPLRLRGRSLRPGIARGPLVGGNASMLCHLAGTPYLPSLKGCILAIEDTGEAPYRLDRMLTHLRLAGCLRGLAGIAVGEMVRCGDPSDVEALVADHLGPLGIPAATGLPVGHGRLNRPFPIGVASQLDTIAMTLSFLEKWTA